MNYQAFIFNIVGNETDYQISVSSPAGSASFTPAITPRGVQLRLRELSLELFLNPDNEPLEEDPPYLDGKVLGIELFQLLFPGEVYTQYCELMARHKNSKLLLILKSMAEDTNAFLFQRLPWELMLDKYTDSYMVLDSRITLFRQVVPRKAVTFSGADTGPVSLAVATPSPKVFPPFDALGEVKLLEQMLVSPKNILSDPNYGSIKAHFSTAHPQIFHFVGHTVAGDVSPALAFELPDSSMESIYPKDLAESLLRSEKLRFVMLNTCQAASGVFNEMGGIASTLAGEGIPVTVVTQTALPVSVRRVFYDKIYGAFLKGVPLDEALARARLALYVQFPNSWHRNIQLPLLP